MATQLVPENLKVAGARLPAAYEAALVALAECADIDECQGWANKAAALASYARQAEDDTLHRTAVRIQSRAIRRAGELLTEMRSPGSRTDLAEPAASADQRSGVEPTEGTLPRSATAAARAAGMSEHQHKTAVRVANLPRDEFEAAVESPAPPTVTALAEMGKRSAPGGAGSAGFQEQIQLMGHARRLAEFAGQHDPAFVGRAVTDYNRRELRGYVARCRRFLAALAPMLRENRDGI